MNGQEYAQLFNLVQEARDAALAALGATREHSKRLDILETTVSANSTALSIGRFGAKAMAVIGGSILGFGGLLLTALEWFGGGDGTN